MSPLLNFIFKTGVAMLLLATVSYSAYIEIEPNGFIEAVTDAISISCSPDGTGARASEILVMEISKDGATSIANIQPPSKIRYGNEDDRFVASGVINNTDIPSSFLNLTISYPSKEDAGTYKCVMSYIDEQGLVKQDTATAELMLNSSDSSSTEDRVKNLESALENLLERIKTLEKAADKVENENKNQSLQIEILRERADYAVAFSAAVSEEKNIVTGDTVVFSEVIINEGQGYNETTGIFTAPRAGLYVFHLVLEIGQGGAVGEVFLNVGGKDMAKMYTQDKDFGDQGAITVVDRLKQGDTAMAEVYLAGGVTPRIFAERLCIFSGYLVRT